ncbi:MAG: hypothetical protein CL821_07975 [Crocinitomicaceae bacterium]|nr:hypothetical protein [Crocinitomicaceae bacterium]
MSKAILIFINIIGFLIFTILNVNDIEITHVAPSEIGINQETEVSIVINKNDFSGPGRLRLDFNQALNIDVKEKFNAGSSFTFKDNEVLFIWYDLPNEKNIEITYIITAEEGATGMKKIKGDFSFINDNERKQLKIPDLIFKINKDLIGEEKVEEKTSSVETTRIIEKADGGYIVTISAKIENHKGFARIKEELPTNSTAEAIETSGSVFKNVDGFAKFIWSELSDTNEEIIVKYKLNNFNNIDSTFSIKGVYSSEKLISDGFNSGVAIDETTYIPVLNNNEILANKVEKNNVIEDNKEINEEVIMEKKDAFNDTELIAENERNNEKNINNTPKDTQELIVKKIKKNVIDKIVKLKDQKSNDKADNKNVQNVITHRKINNNVNYKVQILAGHQIINSLYLAKEFNYKGDYEIESHMGWIKYTVGNHSEYKKARDSRNELKNHEFPGPFVSAYNYGERISVQEALILSKQNWIP